MNRSYLVKKTIVSFVILLAGLVMWGCHSPATTPSIVVDTVPTVQIPGGLKVEGKLVPKEYVDLSFNMGGTVTELGGYRMHDVIVTHNGIIKIDADDMTHPFAVPHLSFSACIVLML